MGEGFVSSLFFQWNNYDCYLNIHILRGCHTALPKRIFSEKNGQENCGWRIVQQWMQRVPDIGLKGEGAECKKRNIIIVAGTVIGMELK